jgi:hypothetical protein
MATKSTKRPAKKTKSKTSKQQAMPLVRLESEAEPFMTMRVNRETFYWVILGLVVVLFASWIMKLQSDVQSIYDQVDAQSSQADVVVKPSSKK